MDQDCVYVGGGGIEKKEKKTEDGAESVGVKLFKENRRGQNITERVAPPTRIA